MPNSPQTAPVLLPDPCPAPAHPAMPPSMGLGTERGANPGTAAAAPLRGALEPASLSRGAGHASFGGCCITRRPQKPALPRPSPGSAKWFCFERRGAAGGAAPPPALPRCGPEPAAIQRLPRSRGRAETKPGLQNQAANGDGSLPRGLCRRFGRILRRIWALSTSFGGGEEDEEGDEHCVHRVLSALRAQHLTCALRCTLVTWRARHSACSLHSPLVMICAHHGAHSLRCMFTSQALHVCLLGTFQARCSACSPRCMLGAPRIASAQPQGCSSPAQAKDSAGAERPATALLLRSRHVFGGCLTRLCRVLTFCCLRSPPAAGTGAGHVLKAPAAVLLSRSEPGDKAATSR